MECNSIFQSYPLNLGRTTEILKLNLTCQINIKENCVFYVP